MIKQLTIESREVFLQKARSFMFDFVLNMPLYSFNVNFALSYSTVYQRFTRKDYFSLAELKVHSQV